MTTHLIDLGIDIDLDGFIEDSAYREDQGHYRLKTVHLAGYAREYKGALSEYHGTTLHSFFSLGGWDETGTGRIVTGGEKVQGPCAYMYGNGVAITSHRQPDEFAILIEEGHILTIRGAKFRVVKAPNRNFELKPIA